MIWLAALLLLVAHVTIPDVRTASVMVWLPDAPTPASGMLLKGGNMVLTARHVVNDATGLAVYGFKGATSEGAVGALGEAVDVALIVLDSKMPGGAIVDCRQPHVGERLAIIGHSAVMRWAAIPTTVVSTELVGTRLPYAVVISSPGVSGMSGAGVLDAAGHVVGVFVGTMIWPLYGTMSFVGFSFVAPMDKICADLGWKDEPWVLHTDRRLSVRDDA